MTSVRKKSPEDIKNELTNKKLELEIAELKRPLWTKPAFLTSLSAAIISIALGHYTGWFNVQLTKLENKKFELTREIETFETQKQLIVDQRDKLLNENNGLKSQISKATLDLIIAKSDHAKELGSIRQTYETQIAALKTEIAAVGDSKPGIREGLEAKVAEIAQRQSDLEDEEERIKKEIRAEYQVDDDGCFVIPELGEQHCLNF